MNDAYEVFYVEWFGFSIAVRGCVFDWFFFLVDGFLISRAVGRRDVTK